MVTDKIKERYLKMKKYNLIKFISEMLSNVMHEKIYFILLIENEFE